MKNRLRVLRAELEWSQAELAERLRVSRQTVNAIETGKYDPSLELAFRVSDLFKLPIEAIFKPDSDQGKDGPSLKQSEDPIDGNGAGNDTP
jgi:putative transcriptional regulator